MEIFLKNATITNKNGEKKLFDAVFLTEKGVYIGIIDKKEKQRKKFEEYGFIPRARIEKITVINGGGKQQDIDFKNKIMEEKNE